MVLLGDVFSNRMYEPKVPTCNLMHKLPTSCQQLFVLEMTTSEENWTLAYWTEHIHTSCPPEVGRPLKSELLEDTLRDMMCR